MRMKRTMRSSSSTTRMRRRSNSSGISFPHKANQVLFLFTFKNFNQGYLVQGPDHFDHIMLKVMNILTITQAWIADNDERIVELGEFLDLTDDGRFTRNMQDD